MGFALFRVSVKSVRHRTDSGLSLMEDHSSGLIVSLVARRYFSWFGSAEDRAFLLFR